ncbi:GNAT family N-acetyltransferase [Candidatus Woesearchaeota archaeon]|nr:GNAT family N-acetyltransferase [Candidatus Woesearchaeota archaeon]
MKLRKAEEKDAAGIAAVLEECYNIDSVEEGIKVFKEEASKKHNYIVADIDGRIAGIVTWKMHGLPKHGLCELDRIAVLKEFRGRSVGKALFNALIEKADSEYKSKGSRLRRLYILTHADNKVAQSFYVKMGCTHEATLKSHYYKGTDEFVFSRFF